MDWVDWVDWEWGVDWVAVGVGPVDWVVNQHGDLVILSHAELVERTTANHPPICTADRYLLSYLLQCPHSRKCVLHSVPPSTHFLLAHFLLVHFLLVLVHREALHEGHHL